MQEEDAAPTDTVKDGVEEEAAPADTVKDAVEEGEAWPAPCG